MFLLSIFIMTSSLVSAEINGNTTTECGSEDGKNYYVKGGHWEERCDYENGEWICSAADGWDICETDKILDEGYCENNKLVGEKVTCINGCVDGACVNFTTILTCIDSDNGKDYYMKGQILAPCYGDVCYGEGFNDSDYCLNDYLTEYYCIGNDANSIRYNCIGGCVEGQCIKESFIQKILNWFKRLFGYD